MTDAQFALTRPGATSRKKMNGRVLSKAMRRMTERLRARRESAPVARGFKLPGSQKKRS
jgi:hypothetical protein